MEILLISDSKLKITLTSEDMREFDINCDTVDYHSTETRRAFWRLLDDAKHETGFDAASDRVCIQFYPSREGGCEIYVTKVAALGENLPAVCGGQARSVAFLFEKLEFLMRACRQLVASGFGKEGRAFLCDGGEYMLFIDGVASPDLPPKLAFVREFGREVEDSAARDYVGEHGKCICRDGAVGLFSELI